jgi:hypothetical protein
MNLRHLSQVSPHVNGFTFEFPDAALDEVRSMYIASVAGRLDAPENLDILAGGQPVSRALETNDHKFLIKSYGSAPLLWISSNDSATYDVFKRAFNRLGIDDDVKRLVDYRSNITMYCGFFVVSNHMPSEVWHVDYRPGANAYTLLTPLFDLEPGHGQLLFKDWRGATRRYTYQVGEGIIVGDYFDHTTEPYEFCPQPRVLLSLTFGTDSLEYWEVLSQTIGDQSQYLVLPCGHERTSCSCVR